MLEIKQIDDSTNKKLLSQKSQEQSDSEKLKITFSLETAKPAVGRKKGMNDLLKVRLPDTDVSDAPLIR